jgi:hypothetical protein
MNPIIEKRVPINPNKTAKSEAPIAIAAPQHFKPKTIRITQTTNTNMIFEIL